MTGAGTEGDSGVVHWITGLPCTGKTTVGEALVRRVRTEDVPVVLLDGDALRRAWADDLGFSRRERLVAAARYGRLSRLLAEQGMHVVVCTVSLYTEVWAWNRQNLSRYLEVHLVASESTRLERDRSGTYAGTEVPGKDLPVDDPIHADLRLVNDGAVTPEELADQIWSASPLSGSGA